jgi:hypothetical protein
MGEVRRIVKERKAQWSECSVVVWVAVEYVLKGL